MNVQMTRTGHQVVRVRDKRTGHQYTIGAESFDEAIHEESRSAAVDDNGQPVPPKHHVPLDEAKAIHGWPKSPADDSATEEDE